MDCWTELPDRKPGEQVALCESCARHAEPQDVPAKRAWIRRERIAEGLVPGPRDAVVA